MHNCMHIRVIVYLANGGVGTASVVKRVREKVDGGVTTDFLQCILVFTRRKLDDHLRSRTSIISRYLVDSCSNRVCLSYTCYDFCLICLDSTMEAGMRKHFDRI
jgi:hypothetical protein